VVLRETRELFRGGGGGGGSSAFFAASEPGLVGLYKLNAADP
jgi:hypothetical protein